MDTWQAPRADKVSKIVSKVVWEDFGNTVKNDIDYMCRFFCEFFYDQGGGTTTHPRPHPPDAIYR